MGQMETELWGPASQGVHRRQAEPSPGCAVAQGHVGRISGSFPEAAAGRDGGGVDSQPCFSSMHPPATVPIAGCAAGAQAGEPRRRAHWMLSLYGSIWAKAKPRLPSPPSARRKGHQRATQAHEIKTCCALHTGCPATSLVGWNL